MSAQVDVLAVMDDCTDELEKQPGCYYMDAARLQEARAAVAALIEERDALRDALREAEWRLSCIGTPRDAQGRYHKDGEWTFGDALPNAADAREVAYAFALIRSALTTGESA